MWEDVAIGYEHTIDDATGDVVYTIDDNGDRVPRIYRIRVRRTPREVLVKVGKITREDLLAALTDGFEGLAGLLSKLAGRVVDDVLDDPTVDPAAANAFLGWLGEVYGLMSILGLDDGGDDPDPFDGPADPAPQPGEPSPVSA